eukprot:11274294-Alexandrium_andersonii.AAC.1
MAGGGGDEQWANWRPYHGAQPIGAPPNTGGATGAGDGQQDEWDWGPRRSWWGRSPRWWNHDLWWSRGN